MIRCMTISESEKFMTIFKFAALSSWNPIDSKKSNQGGRDVKYENYDMATTTVIIV